MMCSGASQVVALELRESNMKTYITHTDANDFEVRVEDKGRHNGKMIASCPTEALAVAVSAAVETADYCLDCVFEVHTVEAHCRMDCEADDAQAEDDERVVREWSLRDEGRNPDGTGESYAEQNI